MNPPATSEHAELLAGEQLERRLEEWFTDGTSPTTAWTVAAQAQED